MNPKYILVLLTFPFIFSFYCVNDKTEAQSENVNVDSTVTVRIAITGDIMCHSVQFKYAKVNADSFDFVPVYRYIKQYLEEPDFTVGNLETVTAGRKKGYSGYPFFNTPDEFIYALRETGFDLLTTSNNHSLDQGESGVLRTIKQINKNSLHYNGTYISDSDRDSLRIFSINGIKIAFLAYSYGTNGNPVPRGKDYLINLIDTVSIGKDIIQARSEGAEIIFVHYHFGEEYKSKPSDYQKNILNKTIEYGADIIIGGHPHVIQTSEFFQTMDGSLDTGFAAYSLGNFISNQRWRFSDAGIIVYLDLSKHLSSGKLSLSVDYTPTWVFKGSTERGNEYLILPSESYSDTTLSFLNRSDRDKMKQAYFDTKEIFSGHKDN